MAIAVIAATFSAAVYVHERRVPVYTHPGYSATREPTLSLPNLVIPVTRRPSSEDAAAVLIALGGLAAAVGIAHKPRS